jgi:hypothetical protein
MTKFNAYLIETEYGKPRSTAISAQEAEDLIMTKCSASLQSTQIYRGVKSHSMNFALVDPTKGSPRISANTDNYYTLLIDNLPAWRAYPKRSKSIICSTSLSIADSYGTVYRVYPFNNAIIGVCTDIDIWDSFTRSRISTLSGFNDIIHTCIARLDFVRDKQLDWTKLRSDFNYLVKVLKQVDSTITEHPHVRINKVSWFNEDMSFYDNIVRVLDPNVNGFKVVKPGANLPANVEVWVGGAPSVLINTAGKIIL